MMARMLRGPQDATVTDTASDLVRQMRGRLGGSTLHPQGIHWVRVFRSWHVAASLAGPRLRRHRTRAALRPIASALDLVKQRVSATRSFSSGCFAELASVPRRGRLVAHLVRDDAGRALG
jgi:hypothetical protein